MNGLVRTGEQRRNAGGKAGGGGLVRALEARGNGGGDKIGAVEKQVEKRGIGLHPALARGGKAVLHLVRQIYEPFEPHDARRAFQAVARAHKRIRGGHVARGAFEPQKPLAESRRLRLRVLDKHSEHFGVARAGFCARSGNRGRRSRRRRGLTPRKTGFKGGGYFRLLFRNGARNALRRDIGAVGQDSDRPRDIGIR